MRRMHRGIGPALLVALTLVSACSATVAGHGRLAAVAPRTHDFPSSTPNATPPADLAGLLLPPPRGSHDWGNAWARNVTPSVEEWVTEVYAPSSRAAVVTQLLQQGIHMIAHRTWVAGDDNQADLMLLSFATPMGAADRYRSATAAKAQVPGEMPFDVPGVDRGIGYADATTDKFGNVPAIVYAVKNNVVVELFYYSEGTLRTDDAIAWTQGQVDRLP